MPSDFFEDNVTEEVKAPTPTPVKAKEVKVEAAPTPAPLAKLSREELAAPVAARAASIAARIPGIVNPQEAVPATKENPATDCAVGIAARFLAARALRNG